MITGILLEGFIYSIMALGVFITFRILDFPDMTVDGSFPMGAAVVATLIVSGHHYTTALLAAFLCGLIAGTVTALIHIVLKIHNLLAGIITLMMLFSVNMRILGHRSNVPLYNVKVTLMTWLNGVTAWINNALGVSISDTIVKIVFFAIVVVVIKLLLDLFFATDMGMAMISMGDNPKMVTTLGINENHMKIIGVSLANGLVALSGGFIAMYMGFADVNLGQGIIVSGLAAVMIGEFVIRNDSMFAKTSRVILGCTIYRGMMFLGRQYGYKINMTADDLKLVTGLLLIICLAFTRFNLFKKRSKYTPNVYGANSHCLKNNDLHNHRLASHTSSVGKAIVVAQDDVDSVPQDSTEKKDD